MSALPIPATDTATDPIASPSDLCQRWRALVGQLGFDEHLLRITFIGNDRRMLKVLTEVEIGSVPDPRMLDDLMTSLRKVLGGMPTGSTAAVLLTRPGHGGVSTSDRTWAQAVAAAAARRHVPIEPVFRANDDAVVQVSPHAEQRVAGQVR